MITPFEIPEPHALPAAEVARRLEVEPAQGLTAGEAARRAGLCGPNELAPARHESVLRMILEAATEPFVVLLAVAGLLAIWLGEIRDGLLVMIGLVPIVGADVVTEFRGQRSLEALREASAPVARVRRDGAVSDVPAADLVPGDVVLLGGGDVVPADLRLVRAERLQLDRSLLTGESLPEPAGVEPDAARSTVADQHSIAHAGTSVVAGRGEGIVIAIGGATEMGAIAQGLAGDERRRSPLQRELDRLVRILLVVAIGLIGVTAGLGFLRGFPAGDNVLAGISAAIAAIPEEPPVLLAVILGLGAYRLLRRGVQVRHLNAEETLGAVDLILTDKTGTLTENRLAVRGVRTPAGEVVDRDRRRRLLTDALRAEEDAWRLADGVRPNSFTRALTAALAESGLASLPADDRLIEAEPASDAHPYSRAVVETVEGLRELALGAAEAVLGGPESAPDWWALVGAGAAAGERLVVLAERPPAGGAGWSPRAVIAFADPLRSGIRDAVSVVREAGIQILVVTGDHPGTAASIAREAGIEADHIVTGQEIDGWDDREVATRLAALHVVARATPAQKMRLVHAARAHRRSNAVTGDGVNDAPALHASDVAVAMGSGTAVAKGASDLVLGDDSFATLTFALREGRRIVANMQKGLVFLVSTHVAMLGFLLVATLVGYDRPLVPLQILWLELFIDTSTSIAFEREPEEPGAMRRPPRRRDRPLLTNTLLSKIAVAGSFSALAALVLLSTHDGGIQHATWLAYTALVVGQAVRAYANRSLTVPIWRLPMNGFLLAACVAVIAIQVFLPILPALATAFHATPLDPFDWSLVAIVALAPAVLAQILRAATAREWVG
ncbi:MAG: cation-translocating P-type ATPase [Candidatus Limnocylindrales bacterium]